MTIRYANLTLKGVKQEKLISFLTETSQDAYVSPNFDDFVTIYHVLLGLYTQQDIDKFKESSPQFKRLLKNKIDIELAALVGLTEQLSQRFNCIAIGVSVEDCNLLYYLYKNGLMIDSYTTSGAKNWTPGCIQPFVKHGEIKGGDAKKLCDVFSCEDKRDLIETILNKPNDIVSGSLQELSHSAGDRAYDSLSQKSREALWADFTDEYLLDLPRQEALLQNRSYQEGRMRHEALSRVLGMRPCWTAGMDYLCAIGEGDMEAYFEYDEEAPSIEEAHSLLRKT